MPSPYDLIPVFSLVMDILWIYAWQIGLTHLQQLNLEIPPINFISYIIFSVGTYTFTRLLVAGRWSLKWVRLVALGFDLALLLVLLRLNLSGDYALLDPAWLAYAGTEVYAVAIALAAGFYLIWRCFNVDRQAREFHSLYRHFVMGLAAFIFLLIIWGFAGLDSQIVFSIVGLFAFSYFGLGLLTLAMVNLKSLQAQFSHHQEVVTNFRRRWLSMLVILIAALLVVAVALGSFLNSNLANAILHGLAVTGDWLGDNIIYLFYPIGFIVQLLSYVLAYLIHLIRREQPSGPNNFNMQEWINNLKDPNNVTTPDYLIILMTILKWAAAALAAGLIIYFLWRSLRRYQQGKSEEGFDEENESLWSWLMLKAEIKTVLNWLFGWLRRRKQLVQIDSYIETPAVQSLETEDHLFTIRELYRAVLWRGRETGIPRRKGETPYEYLSRLESKSGEAAQEIRHLTEAYVQARYGLEDTEPEKLRWLNRLWQALRSKING